MFVSSQSSNKPRVQNANLQSCMRKFLSVLVDYMSILLAEKSAMWMTVSFADAGRYERLASPYLYFWIPVIFILFYSRSNIYHMRPILDKIKDIFYCTCNGLVVSLLFLYFAHKNIVDSVVFPVAFAICVFGLGYAIRYLYWRCLESWHLLYEPVILIGAGKTAEKALRFYEQDLGYRYDVVGVLEDYPENSPVAQKYSVLGGMWEADRIVQEYGVKTIVIAAPGLVKEQLQRLINKVQPHVRNISFVPDLLGTQMMGVEASVFFTEEMLVLNLRNNLARRKNIIIKRLFDLLLSAIILLPVLVVMLCVAVAIRLESDGPAFFNAMRIGKGGKEFLCYKFRSMYVNADEILDAYLAGNAEARAEWNEFQKLKGYDPRVTQVGRIIRRTSLDELPQIVNVLLGDMSLVGPRPYLPREKEMMGSYFDTICIATPGITGLWQVSGRNDVTFYGRLHLDEWYIRNWSVWVDLMCLFKTVKIVLFGKGAY